MKRKKTVKEYLDAGAVVVHESKSHVTLKLRRRFHWGAFILLSLVFNIFGLVGYLVYHGIRKYKGLVTLQK